MRKKQKSLKIFKKSRKLKNALNIIENVVKYRKCLQEIINGPKWSPLRLTIDGKRRFMQLWSKHPRNRGKMQKRGKARVKKTKLY